jgi:membrane protease YdiL (CAAX protease family)
MAIAGVFGGLTARDWHTLWSQPFSVWEGTFFAYPAEDGWRPHYLTSLLCMVLVPTLASRLLRRSLPSLVVNAAHRWDYLAILTFAIIDLAFFHFLGRDETYGDLLKAATLTIPSILFLAFIGRVRLPGRGAEHRLSGGWLLVSMLLAWVFVVIAKPDVTVAVFLFNLLFIGFAEEYAFRGVIQGYLLDHLSYRTLIGISWANLITAALFALMHNPSLSPEKLPWLLSTFAMGLAFGVARERTGSWFAPAVAHGANAFYFLIVMLIEAG